MCEFVLGWQYQMRLNESWCSVFARFCNMNLASTIHDSLWFLLLSNLFLLLQLCSPPGSSFHVFTCSPHLYFGTSWSPDVLELKLPVSKTRKLRSKLQQKLLRPNFIRTCCLRCCSLCLSGVYYCFKDVVCLLLSQKCTANKCVSRMTWCSLLLQL